MTLQVLISKTGQISLNKKMKPTFWESTSQILTPCGVNTLKIQQNTGVCCRNHIIATHLYSIVCGLMCPICLKSQNNFLQQIPLTVWPWSYLYSDRLIDQYVKLNKI